jgi:hypothetical protein
MSSMTDLQASTCTRQHLLTRRSGALVNFYYGLLMDARLAVHFASPLLQVPPWVCVTGIDKGALQTAAALQEYKVLTHPQGKNTFISKQ